MRRVFLVWMPWAVPSWPSLSLGLLCALLRQAGVSVEVLHANLYMARRLGPLYDRIAEVPDLGGLFFASFLYEADGEEIRRRSVRMLKRLVDWEAPGDPASTREAAEGRGGIHRAGRDCSLEEKARACFAAAEETLLWAARRISGGSADIVGFSCSFQQTVASLALARRLKRRRTGLSIVMGGPAFHGEMGVHYLKFFPFLDYVCLGEGEETVVPLVVSIRRGRPAPREVPGIAFRGKMGEILTTRVRRREDLDTLPLPDYDDYAAELQRLLPELRPWIYFESSRGCRWGARRPCNFCGLNGKFTGYRAKSPRRITEEIRTLAERYEVPSFRAADNLLLPSLLDRVSPVWERFHEEYGFVFFYEVRPDLDVRRVRALRRAGILYVQPGIESFSDRVLGLLRKGTRTVRNIGFLRSCQEEGIQCTYNILYRIPGERAEDYREMLAVIPFLRHLPPPSSLGPLRLDRFSPYHDDPRAFGITGVRPPGTVRLAHAGLEGDPSMICSSFTFRLPEDEDPDLIRSRNAFIAAATAWRKTYRPYTLVFRKGPGHVRILDRRDERPRAFTLRGAEAAIFDYCRDVRRPRDIRRAFPDLAPTAVEAFLDRMVEERFFYRDGGERVVALPVHWKRVS